MGLVFSFKEFLPAKPSDSHFGFPFGVLHALCKTRATVYNFNCTLPACSFPTIKINGLALMQCRIKKLPFYRRNRKFHVSWNTIIF